MLVAISSSRVRDRAGPRCDVHGDAGEIVRQALAFAGVDAGADADPEVVRAVPDGEPAAHGARRAVEDGEHAVAGRLDELAAMAGDVLAAGVEVIGEQARQRSSPTRAAMRVESTMSVISTVVRKRSASISGHLAGEEREHRRRQRVEIADGEEVVGAGTIVSCALGMRSAR